MTTTISFADATDGYIESSSGVYATAQAGAALVADTSATSIFYDQWEGAGTFKLYEGFFSFPYTAVSTDLVVSAYFAFYEITNNDESGDMRVSEFDWGASLTTADWRTPSQINALTRLGTALDATVIPLNQWVFAADATLPDRLATSGPIRVVVYSSRFATSSAPIFAQTATVRASEQSGTSLDPHMVYSTVPINTLVRVLGCQVQLSDGRHAFLEADTGGTSPVIALKWHDGATATTIDSDAVAAEGFGSGSQGYQSIALVRDAEDSLYVLSHTGSAPNTLSALAYEKTGGSTWTKRTRRSAAMPAWTSSAVINNLAAAWHNVGTDGTIMVVGGHEADERGSAVGNEMFYALLNVNHLLTGTGSMLRASGVAIPTVVGATTNAAYYNGFANEVGNALDLAAAPGTNDRGYVVSAKRSTKQGDYGDPSVARYVLNATGTGFSDTDLAPTFLTAGFFSKDAGAKIRVLPVDSQIFVVVTVDKDTGFGPAITVIQNIGTSATFTVLGEVLLDSEGIASLPAPATLAVSSAWDAAYDPDAEKVWFYYFDTANNRRLMRTGIDMNTYLADGVGEELNATVGATGATNHAIRVQRGSLVDENVLISVANKTSGGTQSTIYQLAGNNLAPTAPTLTTESPFDATLARLFEWTFNDPNAGDTQSAYQFQVNTSVGVYEYDTGKVSAAAATFVNTGVAATGNNASVVPAHPAGLVEGDTKLIWASIRNSGTGTVNTPSGWVTLVDFANTRLMGKIHDPADTAPTVTFTGGVANADTIAQMVAFRNLPLSVAASATLLNGSAQNITYPALTVPHNASVVLVLGWKQDDWTSVAGAIGTEIGEPAAVSGDDAGLVWNYQIQTTATNITSSSFTVTGGASAISRGITVALGPAGHTATNQSHTLPTNTLSQPQDWQWRARTWDSLDVISPWASFGTFSTSASGTVTITDPAGDNPAGVITDNYVVAWSVAGTTQHSYRVKVVRTSDSSVLSDTGWVVSVATTHEITGMLTDVEYRIEVTVRNAAAVETNTHTRLITSDYSDPEIPIFTLTSTAEGGYILVSVTNPAPAGDKPEVTSNLVFRRVDGSGDDFVAIAEIDPDGEYKDFAVASGKSYEYFVRGVSP